MIELKQISYGYEKKDETIKQIDMVIKEGQFISIIGKNGSGKSTLAKLIAGILKPKEGHILINGKDTKEKKHFLDIRKEIGIVFQNPENQIIFNHVKDEMIFALENLKLENKEERIKEALKRVGLEGKQDDEAYHLSLGQKQRLTIASVLAMGTKYIVLDEPTAMIDPNGKEEIYNIIKTLKKEGYTIIYVTNVIDEIFLSDEIWLIENGRIKSIFQKENLLEHSKELEESNMKIPEILLLLQELQKENIFIDLQEWNMKELMKKLVKEYKK